MKRVTNIAVKLLFVLVFALPAFGQAAGPATPAKVGLINTEAFYAEKEGIGRLYAAMVALNKEFEPRAKEIETGSIRIETLAKEIQALQTQLAAAGQNPKSPVDVNAIQNNILSKQEEGSRLQTDLKRKQEDAKAAYERREVAVISPIRREIGNALTEYSKSKGYGLVLDISKMIDNGQALYVDQSADITDEFIKFFNTKTPTTATTAPKPAAGAARP